MELNRQHKTLTRCGVADIRQYTNDRGKELIEGKLGEFTFSYQNYYWIVRGRVPIELAIKLYEDPIGKTDIRSKGHCACPHPLKYGVEWYTYDGKKVISTDQEKRFKKLEHIGGNFSSEKVYASYVFQLSY
jgi:hypothetical protein